MTPEEAVTGIEASQLPTVSITLDDVKTRIASMRAVAEAAGEKSAGTVDLDELDALLDEIAEGVRDSTTGNRMLDYVENDVTGNTRKEKVRRARIRAKELWKHYEWQAARQAAEAAAKREAEREPEPIAENIANELHAAFGRSFEMPPRRFGLFTLQYVDGHLWMYQGAAQLCSPMMLVGEVKYEGSDRYAYRIDFLKQNPDSPAAHNKVVSIDIPHKALPYERAVIEKLEGFRATDSGRAFIFRYLFESTPKRLNVYPVAGFWDSPDGRNGKIYVCPTGDVLLQKDGAKAVELAREVKLECVARAGSPEALKADVGKLFAIPPTPECSDFSTAWRFQAAFLLGGVGPLLDLLNEGGLTVAGLGKSRHGKSTSGQLIASAWGAPGEKDDGLNSSGDATSGSHEIKSAQSSGTACVFDEAPDNPQRLVFMHHSGTGRARMDRNAEAKERRWWNPSVLYFSSEVDVAKLLRAGERMKDGMRARMLPIQFDETARLADDEIDSVQSLLANFGHFGPAMVLALDAQGYVADPGKLRKELKELVALVPNANGPFQKSAAFAVACMWKVGLIAEEAGLIPKDLGLKKLALKVWTHALASEEGAGDAEERAVDNLLDFIVANKGGSIRDYVDKDKPYSGERVGLYDVPLKVGEVTAKYYVLRSKSKGLSELGVRLDDLIRKLKTSSMLTPQPGKDKNRWDYVPGVGAGSFLVLPAIKIDGVAPSIPAVSEVPVQDNMPSNVTSIRRGRI